MLLVVIMVFRPEGMLGRQEFSWAWLLRERRDEPTDEERAQDAWLSSSEVDKAKERTRPERRSAAAVTDRGVAERASVLSGTKTRARRATAQPPIPTTIGRVGASMAAMLEVNRVDKAFGGLQAISGLSFDVNEGEIVSVIGPNGAGKTTLFNLITGVYKIDDGDIRFDDRSIAGKNPNAIVDLGIARTFQNLRLFTNLSVLDNVLIPQHHKLRSTVAVRRSCGRRTTARPGAPRCTKRRSRSFGFFGPRLMSFRLHQPVYRTVVRQPAPRRDGARHGDRARSCCCSTSPVQG
ncbi:MAG: ATP-binding cassette domain-containing protein [Trueperaceae bacterium]|nr:ATP-binding cassette domain-containing protein [Trueperaceae bacterium]